MNVHDSLLAPPLRLVSLQLPEKFNLNEISSGKQLQIGLAVGEGVGLVDGDIVGIEVGEADGEGVG